MGFTRLTWLELVTEGTITFFNERFIEELYNIFTICSTKNLKYISTAFSARDLNKQAVV
jgi:hypothetical protein